MLLEKSIDMDEEETKQHTKMEQKNLERDLQGRDKAKLKKSSDKSKQNLLPTDPHGAVSVTATRTSDGKWLLGGPGVLGLPDVFGPGAMRRDKYVDQDL